MQCSCAAGEFLFPHVVSAILAKTTKPILERSTGQTRAMEGLPERTRWIRGSVERASVHFAKLNLQFEPLRAQKTGLFLDQRCNLEFLTNFLSHEFVQPQSMLDICSYAGAWSSAAASAGVRSFTLIDADAQALSMAKTNITNNSPEAQASGQEPHIELRHGDLFEELSKLKSTQRTFDVVVADPPAFAKSKKHLPEASKAYARLIKLAARATAPNGLLILCSCSKNMDAQTFWDLCVRNLGPEWILIHRGSQSPDHTVGTTQASAEYLKCYFFQKRSLENKELSQ
jgi:23S rRNA (cytosine1962-C5)-methyltransferase